MADSFEKILEQLGKKIIDEFKSKESLQTLGDEAAALIKKRVKLGYGLSESNGTKEKLKALSPGYKKQRKKDTLHSSTTPNKSNLTNTGQMLDNLKATIKSEDTVSIGFTNTEAKDKAEWVTEGGRPFNHISKAEYKQLENSLKDKLYKRIKDLLG